MKLSRKQFTAGTAIGAGLMGLPGRVFGANERINIAFFSRK